MIGATYKSESVFGFPGASSPAAIQIFENARVIVDYSVYVPPRKQRGEFGRAELLDREHFSEARNHGIVQGIFENLPHLFKKRGFGDLLEMRKILRRVLHVDIDSVRARLRHAFLIGGKIEKIKLYVPQAAEFYKRMGG